MTQFSHLLIEKNISTLNMCVYVIHTSHSKHDASVKNNNSNSKIDNGNNYMNETSSTVLQGQLEF